MAFEERPYSLEPSPLSPRHIGDLFFSPQQFFSGQLALGKTPYLMAITWAYGIAGAIDRIDTGLLRSEFGTPNPFVAMAADNWTIFWVICLVSGVIGGALLYAFGGWWYRKRLEWSGAGVVDEFKARQVYIYSSFVWAGPAIIYTIAETLSFANYQEAWHADHNWGLLLLVFYVWSLVASYKGATAMFNPREGLALLWFVALPIVVVFGAIGFIASMLA